MQVDTISYFSQTQNPQIKLSPLTATEGIHLAA